MKIGTSGGVQFADCTDKLAHVCQAEGKWCLTKIKELRIIAFSHNIIRQQNDSKYSNKL